MSGLLTWEHTETTLVLSGILDRDSLMAFWPKRQSVLGLSSGTSHIEQVDVSGLEHVDSTGLAMLVRLKGEAQTHGQTLTIVGVSDNLNTLIDLYGVKTLLL